MLTRAGCTLERAEPRTARAALSLLPLPPPQLIHSVPRRRVRLGEGLSGLPPPHFSAKGGDPLLSFEVSGQRVEVNVCSSGPGGAKPNL